MQRGQALIEGVVIIPLLLLLMLAAHWLLNLQLQKARIQNKAANTAWFLSRVASSDATRESITQRLRALKTKDEGLMLSSTHLTVLDPTTQIAADLTRQLDLRNDGLLHKVSYSEWETNPQLTSLKQQQSHTVLVGAGHAVSPQWVRRRIEQSTVLWADAQRNSRYVGQNIARYSAPVDSAWRRPAPSFDWLSKWEQSVPKRYQAGVER